MQDYNECRETPGDFAVKVRQTTDTNCPKGNPRQTEEKFYHLDSDKTVEQVSQGGWGIFNPGALQVLTEEGPGQQGSTLSSPIPELRLG